MGFVGNGSLHAEFNAPTLAELYSLSVMDVLLGMLSVSLFLLARRILRRVPSDQ